jgi:26S proteasome regulatory subunit N9
VSPRRSMVSLNRRGRMRPLTVGARSDPKEALAFLSSLAERVDTPQTQEAFVLASMEAAHFKLLLGDVAGTKETMSRCEKILDRFDAVEPGVHASFYRVSGDLYKAKAEYANYYKNSLLYLACVNIDTDLSAEDGVQRAHDLALAALLGDIYNFGELVRCRNPVASPADCRED